jgi:hypothetical protein
MISRWRAPAVVLALLLAAPAAAAAQFCKPDDLRCFTGPDQRTGTRTLESQVAALAANVVLGGVTAGVGQWLRDGSFRRGFAGGAVGGGLVFAGKRVVGEEFDGAGFLGREVAAVGASVVANASEGRGLLERVTLPVGPVRLHLDRSAPSPLVARLDVPGAIATVYFATRAPLDWRSSLSAGAPVFILREGDLAAGRHVAGVIRLREDLPSIMRATLAHEQVHVAQYDFAFSAWSDPVEAKLLGWSRLGERWTRHLDLGLHLPVHGLLNAVVPYEHQPWEWEAHVLSNTHWAHR